jgi:hypothetical protein
MMRYAILAALSLFAFSTAMADADNAGESAVVIRVSHVRLPDNLPGVCQVNGVIDQVLDGKAFRAGQTISLEVPCGSQSHAMPLLPATEEHGVQLVDPNVLAASTLGGAHIDNAGKLIWEPTRSYGQWGAIWGFRIFEGAPLRLQHV